MTQRLTDPRAVLELVARAAKAGRGQVFVAGGPVEPRLFAEAYDADPELAAELTFSGVWLPGINTVDWAAKHPTARARTTFASDTWRKTVDEGRTEIRALHYHAAFRWLANARHDVALVQVSPPDAAGMCSFGMSADFAPAALAGAAFKVAHINPKLPARAGGPTVALEAFDVVLEAEHPVITYDSGPVDPATQAIADTVASLTPDGATLQFGIGKLGVAALAAYRGRKGMKIHSGMVTEPVVDLLDAGALDSAPGSIVTGIALGSEALYARLGGEARVEFASVGVTHDHARLSSIPRFTAVNSALEIDLFGQVNGEFLGPRQISGVGGMVDFLRAAADSDGGLPIVALNASAKGGAITRIVPRLAAGAVTASRADVGIVVTEFGHADLRGMGHDARAEALIALAASEHRDALAEAWKAQR